MKSSTTYKIFEPHRERILKYLLSQGSSIHLAEDLLQDLILSLLKLGDRVQKIHNMEAYLLTMAKHSWGKCQRYRQEYIHTIPEEISISDQSPNSLDSLIADDLSNHINNQIHKLPKRQKEIFYLSRSNGLSQSEIAQSLNLSIHTVNNHMVRALKTLRQSIEIEQSSLVQSF